MLTGYIFTQLQFSVNPCWFKPSENREVVSSINLNWLIVTSDNQKPCDGKWSAGQS